MNDKPVTTAPAMPPIPRRYPLHDQLFGYIFKWNKRRCWSHVAWDRGEIYIPCTLLVFLVASPAILAAWALDSALVKLGRRGDP
jgi:hypothetical protein